MHTPDATTIGQRLHAARRARGLTLVQLETLSGVPFSAISRLERDRIRAPRFGTVVAVAAALAVEPDWLMWGAAGAPERP
jgi:transcriptional regulator with XRE-family HTH domain